MGTCKDVPNADNIGPCFDMRHKAAFKHACKEMAGQFLVGMKWARSNTEKWDLKIIAIGEGYIMARHRGAAPFVQSAEQFAGRIIQSQLIQV